MEKQHPRKRKIFTCEGQAAAAFANPLAGSIRLRANARSRTPVRAVSETVLSDAASLATGLTPLDPTKTGAKAMGLERTLRRLVIGQDEAVHEIVRAYQTYIAGLCPVGRPVGNFLFLGPTGSGKTRSVEATAEALLGNPHAVIKIDCAEFQQSHEIAKLIGSPPGYLGHRETHPLLTQEALNHYHTDSVRLSLLLFDEIDKASDSLWNLLLGVLDKATLTLGDNRKVDFSRVMIFMTSNIGVTEMTSLVSPKLGFQVPLNNTDCATTLRVRLSRAGLEAARRKFTPEFLNRLDKIVVFKALGTEELNRIIDIELDLVQQRITTSVGSKRFFIILTDSAREVLLTEGTDVRYGARHLKRAIERLLVQPLSNLMATGQIGSGDRVLITHRSASPSLSFFREADSTEVCSVDGAAA